MGSRVLVVHPKNAVRALAAQILEADGFAPIEAETAGDAMAVMQTDPPAVMVIDEQLADSLPRLPVSWIAVGRRAARPAMVAAGARCFVEKPFAPEDLVRAVRWVLEVYAAK